MKHKTKAELLADIRELKGELEKMCSENKHLRAMLEASHFFCVGIGQSKIGVVPTSTTGN